VPERAEGNCWGIATLKRLKGVKMVWEVNENYWDGIYLVYVMRDYYEGGLILEWKDDELWEKLQAWYLLDRMRDKK